MTLTLDLDFMAGTLDSRLTVTRRGPAGYFDVDGVYKYTPHNGAMVTEDFNDTSWWSKISGAGVTINAIVAPDGATTADKINHLTVGAAPGGGVRQSLADWGFVLPLLCSVYAKAGTKNWLAMTNDSNAYCYFDLVNGVIGARNAGGWSSSGIANVGGGWFRCWAVANVVVSQLTFRVGEVNNSITCTSPGDIYLWGAMAESVTAATTPRTYIPNRADMLTSGVGPRFDYDPVTHVRNGLLIEDATANQLGGAEAEDFTDGAYAKIGVTVTADQATAPDGRTSADLITASATPATLANSAPAGTAPYTFSVFAKKNTSDWLYLMGQVTGTGVSAAKAWFNLATGAVGTIEAGIDAARIQNVGNGWYRLSLTRSAVSGSTKYWMAGLCDADNSAVVTVGKSVYLWGGMFAQNKSIATSYFPAMTDSNNRDKDLVTSTGAAFTSWYNQAAGAFIIEFTPFWLDANSGVGQPLVTIIGSTTANIIRLYFNLTDLKMLVTSAGTNVVDMTVATGVTANQLHRLEVSLAANNFSAALDGGTAVTDTAGAMPTVTALHIGGDPAASVNHFYGYIHSFKYYDGPIPPDFGKVWTKVAGVWKETPPKINVAGTWKTPQSFVNVAGTWKRTS